MINRRRLLAAGGTVAAVSMTGMAPHVARAAGHGGADAPAGAAPEVITALKESELIYISPHRSNGDLSRCQAEVWFAWVDDAAYVVTASDAWRARAVERGLVRTRLWVGNVGQWKRSAGAYFRLPELEASADLVRDSAAHDKVLDVMGDKYSAEWSVWGPRFRNGLADGSRVMLRYRLT